MDLKTIDKAVKIISKRVLTPIIYLSEYDGGAEFICFCDGNITIQELYDAEQELSKAIDIHSEILDIREFCESERVEIIDNCKLIYSEDEFIEQLFAGSMLADYRKMLEEKRDMFIRKQDNGSYYLQ